MKYAVRWAVEHGCSVDSKPSKNNHGVLRGPDGRIICRFPLGATDWRSGKNLLAQVTRALREQGVDVDG